MEAPSSESQRLSYCVMIHSYFVIDAHCHIYPPKIAARAVAGTDSFYGAHSCCSGTVDNLLKEAQCGIDRFVVQSVATTPKQVGSINTFIAQAVGDSGGRFTGLGTLHPDSDSVEEDVENIVRLGLHGVKLHPDIQHFAIDDKKCYRIYELCEEKHLPLLMHTGDSRYNFSNPDHLLPVLQAFPALTVVGAHLGGWSVWDEAVKKLAGIDNLYVDCSSCFPFMEKEHARAILEAYGADRVLFGTDYPMWHAKEELDTLLDFGFSSESYRKILSQNAKKVFGIAD